MIKAERLWLDGNPNEQPANTYRDAEHLAYSESRKTIGKELGTRIYSDDFPANVALVGSIEIDDDIIILLQDTSASTDRVGLISTSGEYKDIITGDFGFEANHQAKVKFVKNANNQRIIVWTDNFNKLRFLNIDTPTTASFALNRLDALAPNVANLSGSLGLTLEYRVFEGGSLTSGSYIPIFRYRTEEGVTTNWIEPIGRAIPISGYSTNFDETLGTPNINSGKQIRIEIPVSTNYKFIEVGAIASING